MWEQIIYALIMMVVSAALQSAIRPKVPVNVPEPGKLDTPTAEEGTVIPVVFGTVILKASNIGWYGDATTQPIKTKGAGKK